MLGDCNVVEEAMDRLPPRPAAVCSLQSLCNQMELTDSWRKTIPHPEKRYTFRHSMGTHLSRIDRIYASPETLDRAHRWNIEPLGLPTADHQLITVDLNNDATPEIRRGRWVIPNYLINDSGFLKEIETIGNDALKLMTDPQHTMHLDPQLVFQAYLQTIINLAKELERVKSGKMNSTLRHLKKRRENMERKVNPNNPKQASAALAQIKAITT